MIKIDEDYSFFIEVTKDYTFPCPYRKCYTSGVCDCMNINSYQIDDINLSDIVFSIYRQVFCPDSLVYELDKKINSILYGFSSDMDIYCIDRILTINKLYLPESWDVIIEQGYYGQRISKINIKKNILEKIMDSITNITKLKTIKEKTTYLLNEEYGFVSQSDYLKNWKIESVPIDNIFFPNSAHFELSKQQKINRYSSISNSILGVCEKKGENYYVIDGYHRLSQTTEKKVKIIQLT